MRGSRVFAIVLSVIALLALLAACGDDATPTPTSAPTSTPTEGPTPTPTETPIPGTTPTATPRATSTPIPTATPTPLGERPVTGGVLTIGRGPIEHPDQWHRIGGTGYLDPNNQENLLRYQGPYDPATGPVIEGALATDWSVDAETGTLWTFTLRQGVKWHDGEDFNADDVVATYARALDEDLVINRRSLPIRGVALSATKIDDYTVVIDTGVPNAFAVASFANSHFPIMPEHLITGDPTSDDANERWVFIHPDTTGTLAIGTGPFVMTSHDPEARTEWARFDGYWDKDEFGNSLPYLDGLVSYDPLDESRAFAKFITGDVVGYPGPSSGFNFDNAKALCDKTSAPEDCRVYSHGHGFFGVITNHLIEPMDDPRIVKALRYTTRAFQAFEQGFGKGTATGADTWVDRALYADSTLTLEEQFSFMPWTDPANYDEWAQTARDLLAEAGFTDGVDFPFPAYGSCSWGPLFYIVHVDSWTKAGMRVQQECREGIITNEELVAGRFSVSFSSTGLSYVDPADGLLALGTSFGQGPVGRQAWDWNGRAAMDEFYTRQKGAVDPVERARILRELEVYAATDLELTQWPTGSTVTNVPSWGCLRNWSPGPGMYHNMDHRASWLELDCQ